MPKKTNTNTNAIATVEQSQTAVLAETRRELTPGAWAMIERMAPVMHRAHLFGVTSPEQAAAIMLKGYELGLSITASFELIHVIDGKPGLSPRGAMALLHNNPLIKQIKVNRLEKDGKFLGYECYMERADNGFAHTSRFTLEDAQRAGLTAGSNMGNGKIRQGQGNWEKYPENMCLWRAIGFCADVVAPDVTAGMTNIMKAPEMYGVALTEGGDIIDATSHDVQPVDPMQQLITDFGAEAVLQASGGKLQVTDEEAAEIRAQLEAEKVEA